MSRMLRIGNVPDGLHARLKVRATHAGMSMSDYVPREIRQSPGRPTREEVLARLAESPPIRLNPPPADILREDRNER